MIVIVSDLAQTQIDQIADYLAIEFGEKSKEKFMDKVNQTLELLGINPYIGPQEPLLSDLSKEYHSIVVAKKNKAVYRVIEGIVNVIAFWDCRRDPQKLVKIIQHI